MGIYDTVTIKKFCNTCHAKTDWNIQFKWSGNMLWEYKVGQKLKTSWRTPVDKNFAGRFHGLGDCNICEKRYFAMVDYLMAKLTKDKSHLIDKLPDIQELVKEKYHTAMRFFVFYVVVKEGGITEVEDKNKSGGSEENKCTK